MTVTINAVDKGIDFFRKSSDPLTPRGEEITEKLHAMLSVIAVDTFSKRKYTPPCNETRSPPDVNGNVS